jgi:hypothetical protein
MDKIQEVIDDPCNGNIINIQFISFYEKKKQVKWPFELVKLYLVSTHGQCLKEKSR